MLYRLRTKLVYRDYLVQECEHIYGGVNSIKAQLLCII